MRIIIATCAGLVALSAISAQAAPGPPATAVATGLAISSPIELAAQGVRVRAAAHQPVRAVGLLALGPLRSENVGKSTSPSIFAIGNVWMAGWGITYYLFYRPRQNI